MPEAHLVCELSELAPGERKIMTVGQYSIGVFNVNGKFYALRNVCPHQLAPLCLGRITGTAPHGEVGEYKWEREGEIIRCPWHGWEFDIKDGKSVFNPHKMKVRTYEVTVEDDNRNQCPHIVSSDEEDSSVPTYPISTREGMIYVHV